MSSLVDIFDVREDTFYTCALRPGVNAFRFGVRWVDGVAAPVPGALVTAMQGKDNFHIFPYPCAIVWIGGNPYEADPEVVEVADYGHEADSAAPMHPLVPKRKPKKKRK